jgi:hypothetical protein
MAAFILPVPGRPADIDAAPGRMPAAVTVSLVSAWIIARGVRRVRGGPLH